MDISPYPALYDAEQLVRLMAGAVFMLEMDPDVAGDIVMDMKDAVGR